MFGYERTMTEAAALADARMALDKFVSCRPTGDLTGDRHLYAQAHCERCGNPGHEYRAYKKGNRHRGVIICRGCKALREV